MTTVTKAHKLQVYFLDKTIHHYIIHQLNTEEIINNALPIIPHTY